MTVYSRVMAEKMVSEAVEETWVFGREEAIVDLVDGFLQLWVALIVLARVISVKERVLCRLDHEGNGSIKLSFLSFKQSIQYPGEEHNSPFLLQFLNFWDCHAKDEDVLISHLLPHLHVGSVQCPHCQCSIGLVCSEVDISTIHVLSTNTMSLYVHPSLDHVQHMYMYMIK